MSKRKEFDETGEYIEYETPEILDSSTYNDGGIVSYDPTYVPMNIEIVEKELTNKSKKVITECTEIFFKTGEISKPEYVKAIEEIEVMNLEMMLNQVKVSAHLISSLVRRLNESGTTELSLFRTIMEAQNHALALTMNVSSYVRNLPGYFKGLKFEMSPGLPELTEADLEQQRQLKERGDIPNEMSINVPQLGTKDLLKMLDDADKQREMDEQTDSSDLGEFIKNSEPKEEENIESLILEKNNASL